MTVTTAMRRLILPVSLSLLAWACATPQQGGASSDALSGSNWALVSMDAAAPIAEHQPTLQFGQEYRLSGTSGCNQFYGIYGEDNGQVRIRAVRAGSTRCEAPLMQQETRYFAILRSAAGIEIAEDGTLHVRSAQGGELVFQPAAS